MVHWDSSAKVPAIIYGGKNLNVKRNVIHKNVIASMLDWFPTIMDMAGIDLSETSENIELDGQSLMDLVTTTDEDDVESKTETFLRDFEYDEPKIYDDFKAVTTRSNTAMSQFHGDEIHLSWFLLRHDEYKYVVYGSGEEVAPRLFNIKQDPEEMNDLAEDKHYADHITKMDALLREIVDYPAVAENVESYNKDSFVLWKNSMNETEYMQSMQKIRWKDSW